MTHDLTESRPAALSSSSRRSVLRAGVWTVPAVTLVTAAPAVAATPPVGTWTVTNGSGSPTVVSYRGDATGARTSSGTHYFRFTITVPAGVTVASPTVVLTTAAAGNGFTVTSNNPATIPGGWSVTYDSPTSPKTATFQQASLTEGSYAFEFQTAGTIGATDAPNPPSPVGATLTFSSADSSTGPTFSFGVRAANQPTATDPNGTFIV
jgi:hypothetical protein